MTDIEAAELARYLGGMFSARPDVVAAYTIALKSYDAKDMKAAVATVVTESDRMPSIKRLSDAYYAVRREKRDSASVEYPPCCECQREGGWRSEPGGRLWPPREAMPPYTDTQKWPYGPMCSAHGLEATRRSWEGNKPLMAQVVHGALDEAAKMREVDDNVRRLRL